MRILLCLLVNMLPMRLAAQADCTVIDALERVQFAQLRLAENDVIIPNSVDAMLIVREMGRLDVDKVRFTTKHDLTTLDLARLLAFFDMSITLRQTLITKQIDQTENILNAPSFAQHINNMKRILPIFNCNQLTDVRGEDGQEKVTSTLREPKSGQKITIEKVSYWFVGVLVAGVLAAKIKRLMTIYFARKEWRAKRHRVQINTKVKGHGIQRGGTIHDISCIGSKIQTDINESDQCGARVDILLGTYWREATISWSNTHYMGVQFSQALHQRDVAYFRKKSKSRTRLK